MTICFTNAEGIIHAEIHSDEITIILKADSGDEPVSITIPRFKFQWIIDEVLK